MSRKYIRPNLVEPILKQKIVKTLNPKVEDYWAPTKNTAQSFVRNYIKPNMWFFIVLLIFGLFLLYRYRMIKRKNEDIRSEASANTSDVTNSQLTKSNTDTENSNSTSASNSAYSSSASLLPSSTYSSDTEISNKEAQEYANMIMYLYDKQKDSLREPINRNFSNRMLPAKSKLAYPTYPYGKGSLIPSGSK